MLATLTEKRFSDQNWIFEKKLDGVRALAFRKGGSVTLLSRNKLSFNSSYPAIVDALKKQPSDSFIVDGEIVALEKGLSSFSKLQQRNMSHRVIPVYYFVFDLIYWNGYDLRGLPLIERKKILRKALIYDRRIRFTNHIVAEGETYFEKACRANWEGIIAKRADSKYIAGRSRGMAEVQMFLPAGARYCWLHGSTGSTGRIGSFVGGVLFKSSAPLCRKSRHRFYYSNASPSEKRISQMEAFYSGCEGDWPAA